MKTAITFSISPLALLIALVQASQASAVAAEDDVLLFSFFRGNGEAGTYLAWSEDGLRFQALNDDKPVFPPAPWPGQNLTRDPSIIYRNGKFRAVWTSSWKGRVFGYAESADLVHWSEPLKVQPLPESAPADDQPENIWAPEIHWDPVQKNYAVLFSSTTHRESHDGDASSNNGRDGGNDHRIYVTRTVDGKTFSPAKLFFDQGFSVIDAQMALDGEGWVMVVKHEQEIPLGGKNLRLTFAPRDPSKPWSPASAPVFGPGSPIRPHEMVEGACLLKWNGLWHLYTDAFATHHYSMATSPDLKTWTDRTDELVLPPGNPRHGTIFPAPRSAVGFLKPAAAYTRAQEQPLVLDNYVSTGDNHWFGSSLPIDSPASIEATFELFARLGMRRIYWRGLQEAAWLESMHLREENPRYFSFWRHLRRLHGETPVDRLAVEAAHRHGLEIWGVSSLFDWGSAADTPCFGDYPHNSESRLRIENPEWVPVDRHGVERQGGPIEFSHPEARAALVSLHRRIVERDGYDGVAFLSYIENFDLRHDDEFGFSEPAVAEFQRRHRLDPRTLAFHPSASRRDWRRLRGEYVTAFLREMKAALAGRPIGVCVGPADPRRPQYWSSGGAGDASGFAYSSGHLHFDLETWVREGIVDQLLVWGACHATTQTDAVRDLQWIARGTGTAVSPVTSSPLAERWLPAHKEGVAIVLSLADDAPYLMRCALPEEKVDALESGDFLRRMRYLAQNVEALAAQTEEKPDPHLAGLPWQKIVALTRHENEPNLIVRRLALQVLGKSGDAGHIPDLEAALADPENGVRCMAALALRHSYGSNSAAAILEALARHPWHPLMEIAVITLSRIRPFPKDSLAAAAKHPEPVVRLAALRALQAAPHSEHAPLLVAALADEDRYVRFTAAQTLAPYRSSPAAFEALLAALDYPDPVVNNRAATSLAFIHTQEPRPGMETMRPRIREALRSLFARHHQRSARADADWGYRPAGNALRKCGPEGEGILREFMVQRRDPRLAELAWKVLHLPQDNGAFSQTTEAGDTAAFDKRPAFETGDSPSSVE